MRKQKSLPIDELLEYWIDLSKRPNLTLEDYALFFERAKATMKYFEQVYDASRDKFLQRVQIILYAQDTLDGLLKPARQRRGLSNLDYSLMKDWAKKFISRIKEGFPLDIVAY